LYLFIDVAHLAESVGVGYGTAGGPTTVTQFFPPTATMTRMIDISAHRPSGPAVQLQAA
jgi:hypothetical protein